MNPITITTSDRNLLAWLVLLIGALLTAAGLLAVWLQGMFYAQGFPAAMTFGEARAAFTWPSAFTTLGSLVIAWAILARSLTATWPPKRRLAVFICFVVLVLRAFLKKGLVMAAPDRRVEARRGEGAYCRTNL